MLMRRLKKSPATQPLSATKQVESIFPPEIPVHDGARNVDFQRVHVSRSEEPANDEVRSVCRSLLHATRMRAKYMRLNLAHLEQVRTGAAAARVHDRALTGGG